MSHYITMQNMNVQTVPFSVVIDGQVQVAVNGADIHWCCGEDHWHILL